jgi:hypothetical protein
MVTVVGFNLRTQKEGEKKQYITLDLEGDIEMIQSQNTGRHYATVRRCVVSSTFDPITAERMVGKQMAGSIERVPCDTYDFTVPESGEVISLGYRWDYVPAGTMRIHQHKLRTIDLSKPSIELTTEEQQALQQKTTGDVVTQ